MPQYSRQQDAIDKLFNPYPGTLYDLMIHDYAMAFGIDPEVVEKKDVFRLYEHWAIENNKSASMHYRHDNPNK